VLNRVAARAPLVVRVVDDRHARLDPAGAGLDAALARLLGIVQTAMVDGTWSRLKVCRWDSCQWAFYDSSKNRSGSWCSMAVCGNRAKAASYRRRQRPAGRGASGRRGRPAAGGAA
jgi:predicted RNA-binding Zn ribbon-like protein